MSRRPHETDPELYWIDTLDGEVLRRKNRIGLVRRDCWSKPRLMVVQEPKDVLHRFRNVILIEKREGVRLEQMFSYDDWLAYSPDFDEKEEGEEIPRYWYDSTYDKWVRVVEDVK